MTEHISEARVLDEAARIVERGWTQGGFACGADGRGLHWSDDAAAYCMAGAAFRALAAERPDEAPRASGDGRALAARVWARLADAAREHAAAAGWNIGFEAGLTGEMAVEEINDHDAMTQEQAAAIVRRAWRDALAEA